MLHKKLSNATKIQNTSSKSFFSNVRTYFREYCDNTTIHGYKYVGAKRSRTEKSLWLIFCILSLSVCVYLIVQTFNKWKRSPMIVTFASHETPIHQIPFPAVTICPVAVSNSEIFRYDKMFKEYSAVDKKLKKKASITKQDFRVFSYLSMICKNPGNTPEKLEEYLKFKTNLSTTMDDKFYDKIQNVSVTEYMLSKCKFTSGFKSSTSPCYEMFTPIITDKGVCLTFNMQNRWEIFKDDVYIYGDYLSFRNTNPNKWTMKDGYTNKSLIKSYPRRALLPGVRYGLTILLRLKPEDIDYTCNSPVPGFHVIIHTPARYPLAEQGSFIVPANSFVNAAVTPTMITTSDSLEKYEKDTRKCYFPKEKPLAFFKSYTLNNCKLECHANHTLKACGCVEFFMPRLKDTKICNLKKLNCVLRATFILQEAQIYFNVKESERKAKYQGIENCNCLPMCYDLTYNIQVSTNSFSFHDEWNAYKKFDDLPSGNYSRLNIYFKSDQFVTTQRNELYGYTDFIANFGGLLGLFTGFSVLSFIELLYFLSLRLICNTRLYGHWAGNGF